MGEVAHHFDVRTRTAIIIIILISVPSVTMVYILINQNRIPRKNSLEGVQFWAYQLQGIDEDGAVNALVESRCDLLVLEPTRSDKDSSDFDTSEMVRLLHESTSAHFESKLVIAYVNIGQAEDWRWYWGDFWTAPTETSRGEPDFLISKDPDGWEGNYPVAFWYEDWKEIMLYGDDSSIQQILDDGFDGIYMDWIEAYEQDPVVDVANDEGVDSHIEMIEFIGEIRQYCLLQNPNFILVAQNALSISDGRPEYFDVIDAVAHEHILFDGIAGTTWGDPGSGDIRIPSTGEAGYSTEWYTTMLEICQERRKIVFVVDYATKASYVAESYAYAQEHGFIGFVTQIALSQLPTTYPRDYLPASDSLAVQALGNHNVLSSKSLKSGAFSERPASKSGRSL